MAIGFFARDASDAPDTGGSPTGAEKVTYTWTTPRRKVVIQNHRDSGIDMYVRFNADDAATSVWDIFLAPGDYVVAPDGLLYGTVSIWFTGAATLGTDFSIRGWE